MCGIAGILSRDLTKEARNTSLEAMLLAQKHRGPDATQLWSDQSIGLGHNRLSIIDLSESANQPMHSPCERYVIVFNGEVYNYIEIKKILGQEIQFRTQSDTEVLLQAYIKWGEAMLDKLNGMFAIAIWDKQEQQLFLARDRFGVKPLYYAQQENTLFFASEIKTLWAAGVAKNKNLEVWSKYLTYGSYGLPNETFWKGIHQLPGGCFVYYNLKKFQEINPVRWYDFEKNITTIKPTSIGVLQEQYAALLQDAIRLRFRADVPLGMNVSGGLDSSALIALVHHNLPAQKNIEAFTFFTGNPDYDELPWVENLLKDKPYPLHKVLLKSNDIPELFHDIAKIQDEPFGGFPTLAYSLLFKEARSKGIKVLLDGQGMDEAWAGYDYYHNASNSLIQGVTSSPVKPEILLPEFVVLAQKEAYPTPFASELQNKQYRDIFYTKIPRALRFNDRISMYHGTELREPFLDYRLVELAFAQEDQIKFSDGNTKWLLRKITRELVSDEVALAPKRALQTPQREWIGNELKAFVGDKIKQFALLEGVDSDKVNQIWKAYLLGKQDNSFYIWQWINLAEMMY